MPDITFAEYLKFYQDVYNQAKARVHMSEGQEYGELTIVVDGALDEEHTFTNGTEMGKIVARVMMQAEKDKKPTQAFMLWHNHPPLKDGEECACGQYADSHQPIGQWNMPPEGA